MGKEVGDDAVLPRVLGEPGRLPVLPRAREVRGEGPRRAPCEAPRPVAVRPRRSGRRRRSRSARIASARSGNSVPPVRTPTQISPPGSCMRCWSLQTTGSASPTAGSVPARIGSPRMASPVSAREHGIRIGVLDPGPSDSIADVARGGRGARHDPPRRAEPARRAGRRAHRRHRDSTGGARDALGGAGPGGRRDPQRFRGDDGRPAGDGAWADRDADLPDLDDGRGARLRRRNRSGRRGGAGDRRRERRHSGGGRVRRQLAERPPRRPGRGR